MAALKVPGTKKARAPLAPGYVGKTSKTKLPECSAAMSAWVRARNAGTAVAAAIFGTLAKCRAYAAQSKKAANLRDVGNIKGQVIQHRLEKGGLDLATAKARNAKAMELRQQRAQQQQAKAASAAPKPAPSLVTEAKAAAAKVPASRTVNGKVMLHHVWSEYRKGGGKLGLSEFKQQLADSPDARMKLGLSRLDLVQAYRSGDVKASGVKSGPADFNFMQHPTADRMGGKGAKLERRDIPRTSWETAGAAAHLVHGLRNSRASKAAYSAGLKSKTRDMLRFAKNRREDGGMSKKARHETAMQKHAIRLVEQGRGDIPSDAWKTRTDLQKKESELFNRAVDIERKLKSVGPSMSERGQLKQELAQVNKEHRAAQKAVKEHEYNTAKSIVEKAHPPKSKAAALVASKRATSKSKPSAIPLIAKSKAAIGKATGAVFSLTGKPKEGRKGLRSIFPGGSQYVDESKVSEVMVKSILAKPKWTAKDVSRLEKYMDTSRNHKLYTEAKQAVKDWKRLEREPVPSKMLQHRRKARA